MTTTFQQIAYQDLNSRQKENYNFHKIAARLADYGFNCIPLNDDWLGADFIASHIDGTFLKVQQKGRFEINRKYSGKDLHIAFRLGDDVYVYPHDIVRDELLAWGERTGRLLNTVSWEQRGGFSWKNPTSEHLKLLEPYRLSAYASPLLVKS